MINNNLDIEHLRLELALRSRVQIPDFLQPEAAEAIAHCLNSDVPWHLAERSEGAPRTSERGAYPGEAAYSEKMLGIYAEAMNQYQFAYDSYMLVKAAKYGWDPGLVVHAVLQFFNTPQFIEFARYLCADSQVTHANAQCTRYRSGQFLMPHEDLEMTEDWRYAYVLNLSRDWQPDWGGQLQFIDGNNSIVDTFLPRWNSLSLFRVPQKHQVTMVTPWAAHPRHAITGWWLAKRREDSLQQ